MSRDQRAPRYLRRAFTCEFFYVKRTQDGASARVTRTDHTPWHGLHSGGMKVRVHAKTGV